MVNRTGLQSVTFTITCVVIASVMLVSQANAACRNLQTINPGWQERSVLSQSQNRGYKVLVPDSYTTTEPIPVIMDLQASGISPEDEVRITGMAEAANQYGFLLVAPRATYPYAGGGYTWNIPHNPDAPSDLAFIEQVVEQVENEFCINDQKLYAIGFSGGARLASEIACRRPDLVDGIAAVGGLRHPETGCDTDSKAVSLIAFHGTADPVNPYEASDNAPPYWQYGIETALARWVETNDCQTRTEDDSSPLARKTLWTNCRSDAQLAFYRLNDAGHVWPGSSFDFPDFVGKPEPALPASSLILEFFGLAADDG